MLSDEFGECSVVRTSSRRWANFGGWFYDRGGVHGTGIPSRLNGVWDRNRGFCTKPDSIEILGYAALLSPRIMLESLPMPVHDCQWSPLCSDVDLRQQFQLFSLLPFCRCNTINRCSLQSCPSRRQLSGRYRRRCEQPIRTSLHTGCRVNIRRDSASRESIGRTLRCRR